MKENVKNDTTLLNEVLEKIPNKYMAVIAASKRAKALNDGARPLIKRGVKPTTIAMEEIAAGAIILGPAKPELPEVQTEEAELLPPSDSDSPTAEEPDDSTAEESVEESEDSPTKPEDSSTEAEE